MITNIPNPENYKNIGIECLIQSYKDIYSVDQNDLIPAVSRDDIWKYNAIVLRTAVILIYQGVENIMKSRIAENSPLLLIDQKRSDWKSLPDSEEQDFTELFTIGGNDLIHTFYAVIGAESENSNLVGLFENIRQKRNKIVHGIGDDSLNPKDVLITILSSFTYLLGLDSFWTSLQDKFYSHPGHVVSDPELEFEEVQQYHHLDYLEKIIGKGELNKHFSINLKSRRYFCPNCTARGGILVTGEGKIIENPTSKWCFLFPNKPESIVVKCLVCGEEFNVKREKCMSKENPKCPGNVIYTDEVEEIDDETGEVIEPEYNICLTCMGKQDR